MRLNLIAKLERAKRSSETPLVKKIGSSSNRENLVMTSPYERPSVCPSVPTLGEEEVGLNINLTGELKNAIFSWRELRKENSFLFVMSTNESGGCCKHFQDRV